MTIAYIPSFLNWQARCHRIGRILEDLRSDTDLMRRAATDAPHPRQAETIHAYAKRVEALHAELGIHVHALLHDGDAKQFAEWLCASSWREVPK